MSSDRLRTLRRAGIGYQDGRTLQDSVYVLYLGVLLAAIVGIPVVRAATVLLAQPTVLATLRDPAASDGVYLVATAILFVAVLMGGVRGPALLSPFLTVAVAGNDLPRRYSLRRPFHLSQMVLAAILAVPTTLLAIVLGVTGGASVAHCLIFVVGSVLFAISTGVLWLWSQQVNRSRRALLAGTLASVTTVPLLFPGALPFVPSAWIAGLWPDESPMSWWPLAVIALATVAALAAVPRLLDGLDGMEMLSQAHRWQSVGTLGFVGDFAGAFGQFRANPSVGRQWRAVLAAPPLVQFFVADLVGTFRVPVRFVTGAITLCLAGFVSTLGMDAAGHPGWMLTACGALLGYLAVGVFSDGFRHAADSAHGPSVYRYSNRQLAGLHSALPGVCALTCVGLGQFLAYLAGASNNSRGVIIALAIFIVVLRLYDAAKPDLPVALMAPVPTPAGDASGLVILFWQADSALIALGIGAAASGVVSAVDPRAAVLVVMLAGSALLLYALRRLSAR